MHPFDNLTCVCDKRNTKMASRVELYVLHLFPNVHSLSCKKKKVMFGAEFGPRFKTATEFIYLLDVKNRITKLSGFFSKFITRVCKIYY